MSILESELPVNRAPSFPRKVADWVRKARASIAAWWAAAQPSPRVRRAAAIGAAAVPLALAAVIGAQFGTGLGAPVDVVAILAVATLALLLLAGVLRVLSRMLTVAPRFVGWVGTAAAAVIFLMMAGAGGPPLALGGLFVVGAGATVAGCIAAVLDRERRGSRRRAIALSLVAAAGAALLATVVSWLAHPGSSEHLANAPAPVAAAQIAAPDPSRRGPYAVRTLTYGSGTDKRRPEFGSAAALRTGTVDARPFLRTRDSEGRRVKEFKGGREKFRRSYWGFGPEAFPLNGRVWYPAGSGPFPLVLVVHGNHNMARSSDAGYAWLGELLASRGFITVAVDENFLNIGLMGEIPEENDARAWIVLEHLRLWRNWNASRGNPFHGNVDLGRIALIGHSRGGEAAAIAAAFNRLQHYPDDARVRFHYGFPIRAIVAISPTDGQYNPADRPVPLDNVHYLTMHGGHDGDVSAFVGDRQYHRVRFNDDGEWFKASVYIPRANHAQFNTVWGRADLPSPIGWFLDLQPLLPGHEQRRIGAVCISAFLEAALRERREYRALFRDPQSGRAWLPKARYVTRYEDSASRVVADYEEDVDVTTTTLAGGAVRASGLSIWREQDALLRKKTPRKNHAVYLGWTRIGPTYEVTLPDGFGAATKLDTASRLVLDIAEVDEEPDPDEEPKNRPERAPRMAPLDLTVELRDRNGTVARLPLSKFGGVPPRQQPRYTKLAALEKKAYGTVSEPVFDTLELPLAAFVAASPAFAPADLRSISLAFDRSDRGVVALDRVAFAR